jgi:hypothetical protein
MPKLFNDSDKRYFVEVVTYLRSAIKPKYEETSQHFKEKYPSNKILLKASMQRMEKWIEENSDDEIVRISGLKSDQNRITKTDQNRITIPIKAPISLNLSQTSEEDNKIGSESDHKIGSESDHKNGSQLDPEIEYKGSQGPTLNLQNLFQNQSNTKIHDALVLLKPLQERLSKLSCGSAKSISKEIKKYVIDMLEDPLK